ncbi:uncharacterized protein LOC111280550 [Durio zibethinus]|uniref:Uncharacterized protein LOC111280550 n=1 Tax=Durio zibethinus TaxID=66656 RepID=A0A6P5X5P3_DURZI|nr:uncharacterized protein LOC111280550 [Durio zibethinus]
MASKQIATHLEGAEIYHGAALSKQKTQELLDEFGLPKGLTPLNNLIECKALGAASYGPPEMTRFLEDCWMRKLTGVKSKEMMIWITLSDISVDDADPSKITFAIPMGLSKSFPVTAFEDEAEEMK